MTLCESCKEEQSWIECLKVGMRMCEKCFKARKWSYV